MKVLRSMPGVRITTEDDVDELIVTNRRLKKENARLEQENKSLKQAIGPLMPGGWRINR